MEEEGKVRTIDVVTKGTGATWRRSSPKWLVKHAWNEARIKADWAWLQGHEDEPLGNDIILLFTTTVEDISSGVVAS